MEQPYFRIGEIWRWPSEPDTIRFILRANTPNDDLPWKKGEIVLRQSDNRRLYDFIVDHCPPSDESTAPNYVDPPSEFR
jgi:hypothetical protein